MPRFHLTFDYASKHDKRVVGDQVVIRDSLEDAVSYIAAQRRLSSIHIRRQLFADGSEMIDRRFTFGPSEKVA